jgi:hypothetical protein
MIAIMITSLIAVTMGGMVTAVARSVESDRFNRESVVRGQAIDARLGSYITPSLCVLDTTARPESIVIWLEDSRVSDTVHLTEIRWIEREPDTDTVVVHYVSFPESMSQVERDALDVEVPTAGADWWGAMTTMQGLGYTAKVRLCNQVESFTIDHSTVSTQARKVVTARIVFTSDIGGEMLITAASIRQLQEPGS